MPTYRWDIPLSLGFNISYEGGWQNQVYTVAIPKIGVNIIKSNITHLKYQYKVSFNNKNKRLELWIQTIEGETKTQIQTKQSNYLYHLGEQDDPNTDPRDRVSYSGWAYHYYESSGTTKDRGLISNKEQSAEITLPDYLEIEVGEEPPEKE